jgi:sugar phosphate isomerase/epimerase
MHDDLDGMLRKAAAAGFPAVEVLTFPREIWYLHGDLREMAARDLGARVADHGLTLAGLHLGAIMTAPEAKYRALVDYTKRAIDVAAELGAGIVVTGGPDRATEPFDPFLDALETLAPHLAGTPVRLALENHYFNSLQFIEDYDYVFRRVDSPSIGITLDTGHFTSAGVDPAAVAARFTDKIFHVHIKDHIGTQSVALGTGETNNVGMARVLKAAGYTGYLSQELEVADHSTADAVTAAGLGYMQMLCAVAV